MTRSVSATFDAVAWSWVDHLRGRGCTPWLDWVSRSEPADPGASDRPAWPLPGAAQLETVRRLAARPRAAEVPFAELAELVLHRAAPGRGPDDLPLLWPHGDARDGFGPPPVDPARIPHSELVRVLVGALAELLVRTPDEDRPAPRAARRRRPTVVGSPALAPVVRAALGRGEHAGSGVVVLAGPLDELLGQTWALRMRRGGIAPWPRHVERCARKGRLPRAADPAGTSARWAERVGAEQVHVVVAAPEQEYDAQRAAADALGIEIGDAAAPRRRGPDPAQAELLRRLNQVLRGRTSPDRHRAMVNRMVPLLADDPHGHRLTVPARHEGWLRDVAGETVHRLREGGFRVHGDLDVLLPAAPATAGPADWDLLDLALDSCLAVAGAPATAVVLTSGGARR